MDASSPLISPDDISIPSPAENLLLTSDVLNCVFVSVDAIVTAPPDSVIVTFEPSVNANVSPLAKVLPPAVTVLTAVMYEPVAAFNDVLAFDAVNEFSELFNKVCASTPSTISADKLATVVVDATVNGEVPVDTSDLSVFALNWKSPISILFATVNEVRESAVPALISGAVNVLFVRVSEPVFVTKEPVSEFNDVFL